MSAERLFRMLGLVDPALVEEALEVRARRRAPWTRWAALAACLALVVGLGWAATGGFDGYGAGMSGGDASGSGVSGPGADIGEPGEGGNCYDGVGEGVSFLSYAGPVFPLTVLENPEGLTAERTVTWDFAPGVYPDGEPRQWGAEVTDAYVLRNGTEEDITVTALYPFAGSLGGLTEVRPAVTVDKETVETGLYAGPYSGGFESTYGAEMPDTMNLDSLDSWTEYKALLESGAYLRQALAAYPVLETPVTVYEFSDFSAPHETYQAATQAISFDIDPVRTTVLTYGINGMEWDGSFRRYSYFVPDGVRNEPEQKMLVVLGEDIGDYTLQGYQDGGCDPGKEIGGVSCTVTRSETTLDAVLDRLCRFYQERYGLSRGDRENAFDAVPFEIYRGAAAELLAGYGAVSGAPADRYGDGRLDEILSETLSHDRVLYLSFPVTVPAGGSAEAACVLWKEPSYDFGCSGSENVGLQGYDLTTRLGSSLEFTRQRAALVNAEHVEITGQDYGFDLENGVSSVELDLERECYYLEIRPREG
ncbi:hypothetical protein [uncultured Oscillibacter sp.]|uniref:hypothetical protein n=1 Tax=uncultured Oscillibacter sp. TaxID=876091 RepID=UPI0025EFC1FA|nr:hypothetical protein [uncultured Oscillibacter sp.]